ncbi:MAG: TolC family protein [Longimicrobiales bacterium]
MRFDGLMRSFRLTPVLALALLALPVAAQEQAPSTLTLEEAIELARQNNPLFRATANDEVEADWRVREAFGQFIPSLSVRTGFDYLAGGTPRFGSFSGADLGLARTPSYLFSSYGVSVGLTLSGATFFRAAQARSDARSTEAGIEAAAYTLATDVTSQYLAALRARDNVALQQSVLAAADEAHNLATARFDAGDATRLDVAQAEVTRGRAEVAMIQAENSYETEKVRLLQLIGIELEREVELTSEFMIFEPPWTLATLIDDALRSHPQLAAMRAAEDAARAGSRAAKMQYLPTLSFGGSLASGSSRRTNNIDYLLAQGRDDAVATIENCEFWNRISGGLSSPLPDRPADCSSFAFSEADAQAIRASNSGFPFDYDTNPMSLGVTVSLPIVDGFTRERSVQSARVAADDARFLRRAEELARRAEVTASYNALMTAYRTVSLESRNAETAGEQLFLATERYRLGAGSIVELAQAQEAKAQADKAHLDAIYSFHENLAALEAAVGRQLR